MTSCLARERATPAPSSALAHGRGQNAKNGELNQGVGRLSTTINLTHCLYWFVEIDQFDKS
ncbi:hypothetical protein T4D_13503 [Trichinella pseudospiralis]|uniref:Uncharacterized protein n=1 Tax=Trichinella pseudospiralis TaxID=6337 RepID=A0A0V1FKL7_TRIPS|nr:hypothetical protein T4D_13503 [Trichinella pseudospiralis]